MPPWHGAANVVEDGGREGPEVGDGLVRLHVLDWAAADQRGIGAAFAVFAVAYGTFCRVDAGSLGGGTAAGREAGTVRQDIDVPGCDLGRIDRLSKIWRLSEGRARTESEREHDSGYSNLRRKHA